MRRLPLVSVLVLAMLPVAFAQSATPSLRAVSFLSGMEQPTSFADDGTGRLFVTEQAGKVRIAVVEQLRREPYLDIVERVKEGGECGLLCIVFHPRFAENGRFFVNYTTVKNGPLETVVSEFHARPTAMKADPTTEKEILRFRQPYANHNGGQLAFGPDGMLYIAVGDGGSGGDPHQNGPNLNTWLGKILRIDVDSDAPYRVPADNPFVGKADAKPEIWAFGLRNPWRFSFDRKTGQLWAADVGQNKWEEIDLVEKGGNYGWSAREGAHDFKPERAEPAKGPMIDPIKDYGRDIGQCVTGGYVYRGRKFPALEGLYIYGDFASRKIWALRCEGNGKPVTFDAELLSVPFNISAFGEDREGELYVLDYGGGKVLRLVE